MGLHKQDLHDQGHQLPVPNPVPLTGLEPMLRAPWMEAMRGQDKILPLSRRVVLSSGLRGDVEWRTSNVDPDSNVRTHADSTTWYVVARGMIEITPGCFLRMTGAYVPSGETQRAGTAGDPFSWMSHGAEGHLRVSVTWTDAAAATETTGPLEIALPPSVNEFAGENEDAGGLFATLRTFEIPEIYPPEVTSDDEELSRFCQHVSAEITIEVRGSPRIVDFSVSEVPVAVAFQDSDADDQWAAHLLSDGIPIRPYDENSTTDQTGGAKQALVAARGQVLRTGPCLVQWTGYTEEAATPTATIVPVTSDNDGTTYLNLLFPALTSYDADAEAGWSVSTGGYARRWAANSPFVLRDLIAAVPVLVRVYGRTITAGVGTFRFQTAAHSYVDVVLPVAGADAWSEAFGYLEVGVNPDQKVIGQAFMNHLGASGSLSISAFEVYVSDPGAPAMV